MRRCEGEFHNSSVSSSDSCNLSISSVALGVAIVPRYSYITPVVIAVWDPRRTQYGLVDNA